MKIIIKGAIREGKSTIATLIYLMLKEKGFDVEIQEEFPSEIVTNSIPERTQWIQKKQKNKIIITTEQLPRKEVRI